MKNIDRIDLLQLVQGSLMECNGPREAAFYWLISAAVAVLLNCKVEQSLNYAQEELAKIPAPTAKKKGGSQ